MDVKQLHQKYGQSTSFSPLIALPGRRNLGMGRHWHFFCAIFWILNGKYLRSIDLVDDYHQLGDGQGGFREDTQFYGQEAGI